MKLKCKQTEEIKYKDIIIVNPFIYKECYRLFFPLSWRKILNSPKKKKNQKYSSSRKLKFIFPVR